MNELKEAVDLMQGFKPCQNNVNQVIDIVTIGDLNENQVLNKMVTVFGGVRWVAVYKVAQAIVSGQISIDNEGIFHV